MAGGAATFRSTKEHEGHEGRRAGLRLDVQCWMLETQGSVDFGGELGEEGIEQVARELLAAKGDGGDAPVDTAASDGAALELGAEAVGGGPGLVAIGFRQDADDGGAVDPGGVVGTAEDLPDGLRGEGGFFG